MNLGLQGMTVVVTGGSSGIGLACVKTFLAEGCRVAFCARGAERLQSVSEEMTTAYGKDKVFSRAVSVLEEDRMKEFAVEVDNRLGPADVLVNNAGQGRVSTFAETDDNDWREELELKFFSQIYPVKAFENQLRKSKDAAIVGVNSLLAYQPEPHMVCTSAARAGVQNLMKSMAGELAPGIRVNTVLLGVVVSGQWERRFEAREDKTMARADWYRDQAARRHIPLGRFGEPQEAANAVVFLASPAASFITGARLEVSGGTSRYV
ncbi:MAG: SDR family oxidoreductase [Pseudomonadota bacterium]